MESQYFEDLHMGAEFRTQLGEPVTQAMVEQYFDLTGDRFNIHRDNGFAQSFGLKGAMVPGNLVIALSTGLVYAHGHFTDTLVVQASKNVRFVQPLYVGERIAVVERVVELEDRPHKRYARVLLERLVLNEHGDIIQRVDQDYRVVKREALATTSQKSRLVASRAEALS
jgi:acyl dehydratase